MGVRSQTLSGKPATFDAYYLADFRSLTWFAIRIGASSADEAEDAAQEAMRTVLLHWKEIETPYAYARTAVRCEVYRAKARAARRRDAEMRAAKQDLRQPQYPFEQDVTRVLTMLNALPLTQREVFALAMDGFEPSEIAGITGQNTATVRSNLRHARRKLMRLMQRSTTEATGREANDGP